MPPRVSSTAGPALLLTLPLPLVAWACAPPGRAFGRASADLIAHLWMGWHASREPLTRTTLLGWPDGVDLLPVLGGWLDVWVVGNLAPLVGLLPAFNGVVVAWLVVTGLGGVALARAAGASWRGAAVAGPLLQLDGFVLAHLEGGRTEQVGLGFLALAVAGALGSWRGTVRPVWTGLAGAALLFASWELSLLCALIGAALLPVALWATPRSGWAAGFRRGATALGVALTLAGWWVALFVSRAAGSRSLDDGTVALANAAEASVGLLGWLLPRQERASWAVLACLVALPWTLQWHRAAHATRRAWTGVFITLGVALIFSLGPHPGLWAPGPTEGTAWGPFAMLQFLPVLAWFHWPARLLPCLGLAGVVAAALAVDRLGAWRRTAGTAGTALLLLAALSEQHASGRLPMAGLGLPPRPMAEALAKLPGPGAVIDLPVHRDPARHLRYQTGQLVHERPILFHHVADFLDDGAGRAQVLDDPTLRWFVQVSLSSAAPDAPDVAALQALRAEDGFAFVVVHNSGWERSERREAALAALERRLGPPLLETRDGRIAWELPVR